MQSFERGAELVGQKDAQDKRAVGLSEDGKNSCKAGRTPEEKPK